MVTKEDVEAFLERFFVKVKIFGIRYRDDRPKNIDALLDLEITRRTREEVVMSLTFQDYCQGPVDDVLNKGGEMWVFGKDVKGAEVYIKITMGRPQSHAICISFHRAEKPLSYLFKQD